MAKLDITLDRSMTLNMGNYNSIKPTVGLTVKDVDSKMAKEVYNHVSNLLDALLAKEIIKLSEEMNAISKIGIEKYTDEISKQGDKIEREIEQFILTN
jgi:Ribonuclease G/E